MPLTAGEILDVWDRGRTQSPARRALTLLAAVRPGPAPEAVPVGRRDRALLAARVALFGPNISVCADCPACGAAAEFGLDAAALAADADGPPPGDDPAPVMADGMEVRWRLPDGSDLLAAERAGNPAAARDILIRRTVSARTENGRPVPVDALPPTVFDVVQAAVEQADPLTRLDVDVACPECGGRWVAAIDVPALFWAEVEAEARRLLEEVHTLASAYGWREADILALPTRRRWAYLELVAR